MKVEFEMEKNSNNKKREKLCCSITKKAICQNVIVFAIILSHECFIFSLTRKKYTDFSEGFMNEHRDYIKSSELLLQKLAFEKIDQQIIQIIV